MANEELTKIKTCLVVCPLNTVLNWQNEFEKWLSDDEAMDVSVQGHREGELTPTQWPNPRAMNNIDLYEHF
jgi:hypothetical protein